MATPSRFTAGVSTFPPRHIMQTFPVAATNYQISKTEDYIPYRSSADYLETKVGTAVTGTTAFNWNGGAILLQSGTTAANADYLALGSSSVGFAQLVPGQQLWFDTRVAVPATTSTNGAVYVGLFDNANIATAIASGNGIYFVKPAGQSTFNFAITKTFNGVTTTTTFTNVGDFSKPSGLFNDPNSSAATLAFNATGTTYSTVTVTNPGAGYIVAPIIIATGTAGTGAQLYSVLGGANTYASVNNSSGSLYNPYITASGSGYTAGTLSAEINPLLNLQFWFDGLRLFVGVGGRIVFSILPGGVNTVNVGGTNVVGSLTAPTTTSWTIAAANSLPVGQFAVTQQVGSPVHIVPLIPLFQGLGVTTTTTTNTRLYVDETNIASELY